MALARIALSLAPLIIRSRSRRPAKRLAGAVFSIGFMVLSVLFLLIAAFVWIMKTYGAEFGFLAIGVIFFIIATIVYISSRSPKVERQDLEAEMNSDPLAQYIPEELQNDPRVLALMEKVKEHPVGSTAAAVSLGFIISSQLLGD